MIRISRAKHPRRRKVFSQCKTSAASEGVLAGGSLAGVMRMGASYGKCDVRQCIYLFIKGRLRKMHRRTGFNWKMGAGRSAA